MITNISNYHYLSYQILFRRDVLDLKKKMALEEVGDTIFMPPQVSFLEQVVVIGQRPKVKLEGSSMQIDIKGTVLAQESHLVDSLRKIPGVIASGNGISTIDGYVPSFYVNGRKIASMSEIKNIDIKSIKSIELDTSPGARYSSTENAVINIRTTSFLEGVSFVGHTFCVPINVLLMIILWILA